MAFIRRRGNSYYLVHNVRNNGQVKQIHLACLGRRPRISEDVMQGVAARHPFIKVDWQSLRRKASQELVKPFENNAQLVHDLVGAVRNLSLDIADLHFPVLEMAHDRELVAELTSSLKLLRSTLDVKLNQLGKGRSRSYAN